MDSNKHRLVAALSIAAALALPSTALARHGADDAAPSAEHSGQVEDHQQEAGDDRGTHDGDRQEAEPEHGGTAAPQSPRTETYKLRGSVVSVDPATGTVVVQVKKANHGRRGRALAGQAVTLDLTGVRLRVADSNGDGARDINDVSAGDRVEVRVRLPRSQPADLSQPLAAQRFSDAASHS